MSFIREKMGRLRANTNPIKYWRSRGAVIGKNCKIDVRANLGSEPYLIKMGDNVRLTAGVDIYTHDGGLWVVRRLNKDYEDADLFGRVIIGNNVHIGSNASIMPGVKIGNNCIIGVGAVVTKDVPDNSVVAGVPARVIESVDEYIEKNKDCFLYTAKMKRDVKKDYILGQMK